MSGRPLLFKTEKELQDKITEYLIDYCGLDEYGNFSKTGFKNVPTVTGLALYLGTSRETLMNYEKKEAYFDTIKKAKEMVLSFNESALYSKKINVVGVIFNLKNNWGWKDRIETTNTNIDIDADEDIANKDIADFLNKFALVEKRKLENIEQSDTI